MARYKDPVVAEIKQIRRKISRRLANALKSGRFYQELCKMDREAEEILRATGRRSRARRKAQ